MMRIVLFLLFLVEVHCQQTFPYVSFGLMGQALSNHSYVDLSTVGSAGDNSDSVVCHTDLDTCCSGPQVSIVETGISLMVLDCHLSVVVSLLVGLAEVREWSFVIPLLLDQLVSIAVVFLRILSTVILISQ